MFAYITSTLEKRSIASLAFADYMSCLESHCTGQNSYNKVLIVQCKPHTVVLLEYWYRWNEGHYVCRRVLFLIFLRCRLQGEEFITYSWKQVCLHSYEWQWYIQYHLPEFRNWSILYFTMYPEKSSLYNVQTKFEIIKIR